MPSTTHDGLVALFSNDPTLAARLLRARPGSPRLPAYDEVSVTRSDLGPPVPSDRRVDLALEFRHRRRRTAIVLLEVQLRPDPDKPWTWPNYYAAARDRWRCPVFLIVVTPTRRMAKWCRRTITTPQMTFTPFVLGPDEVPPISDTAITRRFPELGVLSAIIHSHRSSVVAAALTGLQRLDTDTRRTYNALLEPALARHPETTMTSQEFLAKHRMPRRIQVFIDAYGGDVDAGLDAYTAFILVNLRLQQDREKIEAKVRQDAILDHLADRNLRIPRIVRAEIRECTDNRRLRTMLRRALRVTKAEDVLTRKRLPTAG